MLNVTEEKVVPRICVRKVRVQRALPTLLELLRLLSAANEPKRCWKQSVVKLVSDPLPLS